jgi:hypothetical protein
MMLFSFFIMLIAPLAATFVTLAATFAFLLVAAALVLVAAVPVRPSDHVDAPYGLMRIVTFYHQFAGFSCALHRVILNYHIEAGAGTQWRREWIVDQVEVLVVKPQRDAVHMQRAIADIADRDAPLPVFSRPSAPRLVN